MSITNSHGNQEYLAKETISKAVATATKNHMIKAGMGSKVVKSVKGSGKTIYKVYVWDKK
jgi:hypothetical protein